MNLVKDLYNSYGIRVAKQERVRDVSRMTAADGRLFCWKPYKFGETEVGFIARVLRHLENSGYDRGPKITATAQGADYVLRNGLFGMLTQWVIGCGSCDYTMAACTSRAICRPPKPSHGLPAGFADWSNNRRGWQPVFKGAPSGAFFCVAVLAETFSLIAPAQ